MVCFPNCKINLGLRVIGKREDGFHDIETVFYPVPLHDALEIIPAHDQESPSLKIYGHPVPGHTGDNLCIRAWQLLKNDFPGLPAVDIHLLKRIPLGGGLGGGSADGAFMLRILNERFHLGIPEKQLLDYALALGSDCPFFIRNKPSLATGRGEKLQPLDLSLRGYTLVLVMPGIHVNTGWAFSQLDLTGEKLRTGDLEKVVMEQPALWRDHLYNDFEPAVFTAHPALAGIKSMLYTHGAEYAGMSGSGSTIFGLFKGDVNLKNGLAYPFVTLHL